MECAYVVVVVVYKVVNSLFKILHRSWNASLAKKTEIDGRDKQEALIYIFSFSIYSITPNNNNINFPSFFFFSSGYNERIPKFRRRKMSRN